MCGAVACCSNLSCSSPGRNWGLKIPSPSQQVRQFTWRCTLPFRRVTKTKVHSSMVIWTATGDTVIYPWKTKAIYCNCYLQSNNTALKYYDIHCTLLFNHLSICILTLPLHICGIDRHFIFLCCVPPWGYTKKVETCRRFTTCFYISVYICSAIAGVYCDWNL